MTENAREVDAFDYLKPAIRARGWTISHFAKRAGVSIGLAYKWLAEDSSYRINPSPASCYKIAEALQVEPDVMLEIAGHRKPRPEQPVPNPVQSELDLRFARLATTLSKYPRAVWLAVVEANERMADALAQQAEPPVSDPPKHGVSAPIGPLKKSNRAPKRRLPGPLHRPVLAGAAL